MKKLKIKKKSNSISRRPRCLPTRVKPRTINCRTFLKLSFDPKIKLRPFDSESKTTSGCSKSLFSKKLTLNSFFSFYQYKFDFSYQGGVMDQIVSNRIYTAQIQNLVIKWERKNQLMMPRRNHNSIRYARDLLFHVGGQNRMYEFYM